MAVGRLGGPDGQETRAPPTSRAALAGPVRPPAEPRRPGRADQASAPALPALRRGAAPRAGTARPAHRDDPGPGRGRPTLPGREQLDLGSPWRPPHTGPPSLTH